MNRLDELDARMERVVARELRRLDEHLTLGYLEVALLLGSVIAVLLTASTLYSIISS